VIPLAAALLLAAVGLLATGIAQGSSVLEWASFAASGLAVLVLVVGELRRRRRRAPGADTRPHPDPHPDPHPEPEPEPRPEPAAGALAEVAPSGAVPVVPADDGRPPRVPGPQTGRHWAPDPDPDPDVQPISAPSVPPPLTRVPVQPVAAAVPAGPDGEPPAEEVEFTDLLMIMDLSDEVLVVDEHPRYRLTGCPYVAGVAVIPVPMDQARLDGFTPCGTCAPDRTLAARERARRSV